MSTLAVKISIRKIDLCGQLYFIQIVKVSVTSGVHETGTFSQRLTHATKASVVVWQPRYQLLFCHSQYSESVQIFGLGQ